MSVQTTKQDQNQNVTTTSSQRIITPSGENFDDNAYGGISNEPPPTIPEAKNFVRLEIPAWLKVDRLQRVDIQDKTDYPSCLFQSKRCQPINNVNGFCAWHQEYMFNKKPTIVPHSEIDANGKEKIRIDISMLSAHPFPDDDYNLTVFPIIETYKTAENFRDANINFGVLLHNLKNSRDPELARNAEAIHNWHVEKLKDYVIFGSGNSRIVDANLDWRTEMCSNNHSFWKNYIGRKLDEVLGETAPELPTAFRLNNKIVPAVLPIRECTYITKAVALSFESCYGITRGSPGNSNIKPYSTLANYSYSYDNASIILNVSQVPEGTCSVNLSGSKVSSGMGVIQECRGTPCRLNIIKLDAKEHAWVISRNYTVPDRLVKIGCGGIHDKYKNHVYNSVAGVKQ